MKTQDYLGSYKSLKETMQRCVRQISFSHMVADNISDLLPKTWKIESDVWRGDLVIVPISGQQMNMIPEMLDKLMSKIAKALNVQPNIYIDESKILGSFNIYRAPKIGMRTDYHTYINLGIRIDNSEKCDITFKRKMQKVPVLTGYCKALAKKRYLETA